MNFYATYEIDLPRKARLNIILRLTMAIFSSVTCRDGQGPVIIPFIREVCKDAIKLATLVVPIFE